MHDTLPTLAETELPITQVGELDLLPGVFAFLDACLPPELRVAAISNDPGIGRLPRMPDKAASCRFVMDWMSPAAGNGFTIGHVVEGHEREAIAKVLNATFRLQWRECPLRSYLAKYRLYFRDDMADALASAYISQKRGENPESALLADYALDCRGLLYWQDVDDFRCGDRRKYPTYFWNHLGPFYQEGDRIVMHDSGGYGYYLLVRGDRLVWEVESIHKLMFGDSPKTWAAWDHFRALGGAKAFLNGEFVWPPAGWVNPVSDEEEAAASNRRPMISRSPDRS